MRDSTVGIGNSHPSWVLHMANRPELEAFQHEVFRQLKQGEAADVISQTSNHWRKVFSIMAKISFALFDTGCDTWQQYRDTKLLTEQGYEAIYWQPYSAQTATELSLICGFTYAETQTELARLLPHIEQPKLLMAESKDLIVTPYFDWRQLNNETLSHLVKVMKSWLVK